MWSGGDRPRDALSGWGLYDVDGHFFSSSALPFLATQPLVRESPEHEPRVCSARAQALCDACDALV